MMTTPYPGKYDLSRQPVRTLRRRVATAVVVSAAMIIGVLGWRWALVEATTEDGPDPDALVEPATPQIHFDVRVLDVRPAAAAPPRALAKPAAPATRATGRPISSSRVAHEH